MLGEIAVTTLPTRSSTSHLREGSEAAQVVGDSPDGWVRQGGRLLPSGWDSSEDKEQHAKAKEILDQVRQACESCWATFEKDDLSEWQSPPAKKRKP